MRFLFFDGRYINTDQIVSIMENNNKIEITMSNGSVLSQNGTLVDMERLISMLIDSKIVSSYIMKL
jgi:hypothetical protein